MPDTVIIALIGAAQAVTVALVGVVAIRFNRVRRDTSAVRDQVVNDHIRADGTPINMRDENDTRHNETKRWFTSLARDVGGIREEIRGIRGDLRHERDRIDDIEDTLTKKKGKS